MEVKNIMLKALMMEVKLATRPLQLMIRALLPIIITLLLQTPLTRAEDQAAQPDGPSIKFFEQRIRPLLIERCHKCHSEKKQRGELRLDSLQALLNGGESGASIVPGAPEKSLLIQAVQYREELKMPPKKRLSDREIADLAAWVKMGAPWPGETAGEAPVAKTGSPSAYDAIVRESGSFWAFQQLSREPPPAVEKEDWIRSPIDRFILGALESRKLEPSPPATPETLIRRIYFDLTGLPPSPKEIGDFAADTSPDNYEKIIDRLLASPGYGERWGRHWLDVARYADSNGLDENIAYIQAWRYRDWVIDSFNRDKPYDEFLRAQLAGDLLQNSDPQSDYEDKVATGFLSIGPKMLAEDDGRKMELDIIDEQVDTVGRVFMGMTLGCARCHDHKFDPISSRDYYSMASIFKSTKTMENFKVVAAWHEYELPTGEQAELQKVVNAKRVEIDTRRKAAETEAEKALRNTLAPYLKGAWELLRFPALVPGKPGEAVAAKIPAAELQGRGILVEMEKFQRKEKDLVIDTTGYGKGIGVLLSRANAAAEFDLDIPRQGIYQLDIRHAAAESRPIIITVNGDRKIPGVAGEITGTWYPDTQRWFPAAAIRLSRGRNVLRFERSGGPIPHLDKFFLSRIEPPSGPSSPAPEKNRPVVIEVEDAPRTTGDLVIQRDGNGEGIGILASTKRASAELELATAEGGYRLLRIRHAAKESRPVRIFLNGKLAGEACQQVTGGWEPSSQRWFTQGVLYLPAGKNRLRIEKLDGPLPHLDKVSLQRIEPGNPAARSRDFYRSTPEIARSLGLQAELLSAWKSIISRNPALLQKLDEAAMAGLSTGELASALGEKLLAETTAKSAEALGLALPGNKRQVLFSMKAREEIAALEKAHAELKKKMAGKLKVMGVREGKAENLKVHLRGSYLNLGEQVSKGFPRFLASFSKPEIKTTSGRLELARWLSEPRHPLTGRVMANRIWRWHFGQGIVRSTDNFGRLGSIPSHKDLLDWLASMLIDEGWSVKRLHKEILASSTYRMGGGLNPAAAEVDPGNALRWRWSRRRLEAESIRDSLLDLGGQIDRKMGGQLLNAGARAYVTGTASKQNTYEAPRRSVYLPVLRSAVYDVLQSFDFPDPSVVNGDRSTTTIPSQALVMMNSALMDQAAKGLAGRLLDSGTADNLALVRRAFLEVLGRSPGDSEENRWISMLVNLEDRYREAGEKEAKKRAWRSFTRVLLSSNEFIYVE
jgi:cytochrome c553